MSSNISHKEEKRQEAAAKTMQHLQEGKLPKNEELVKGIDRFNTKMEDTKPKLSVTGQKASEHVGNILETAKEMIETKNEDEHFQKAVYHMYNAGKDQPITTRLGKFKDLIFLPNEDIKGIQSQAKQHVDSILTIVKLCIMSPEFRQTLNEFLNFFSSLAHKSSKKMEEKYHRQGHGESHAFGSVDKASIHANGPAIKSSLEHKLNPAGDDANPNWLEPHEHYQWMEKEGKYSLHRTASDASEQSQEQEEKLINLVVDLLQRIHSYPEFSNSVDYLSDSLEHLQANWRENVQKLSGAVEVPDNFSAKSHRQASKREIIEFIENWIGEDYSLDPLIRSILTMKDIVQRDPELRRLFHDLRTFFTKSAKDANYVNNKERVREDARDLIHRTRSQLRNKHREEFQRLKREIMYINDSIQNDDSMLKLRDEVKDLVRTLTTDAHGNVTIKPELLNDAQLLIQALFDTIKYLPLPPIEREDEKGTFRLENIVVNATDILPSQIHLSTKLDATGQNNNSIEIRLRHIRAHLRNVKFYLDKRSGFPHIKESGFADVDLAGKHGMDLFISVRPQLPSADGKQTSMFHVNECTCDISKLRLRLRDTNHDGFYKLLSPVINAIARRRIETMVQENIEKAINQVDRAVTKASEKSARSVEKAKDKAEKQAKEHKDTKHGKSHDSHAKHGKDTHAHAKDTHAKDTHAKDTHAKGAHAKDTHAKDTHMKEAKHAETKAHNKV